MGSGAKRISVFLASRVWRVQITCRRRKTVIMPRESLRLIFCEYLTFKTRQGNRTLCPINAGILAPLTRGSIWATVVVAMAEEVWVCHSTCSGSSRSAFVNNLVPETLMVVGNICFLTSELRAFQSNNERYQGVRRTKGINPSRLHHY